MSGASEFLSLCDYVEYRGSGYDTMVEQAKTERSAVLPS